MNTNQTSNKQSIHTETSEELPSWLDLVREQVVSLKFGSVQITVHDSRVTQIERVEKVRLDRPAKPVISKISTNGF